MCAPARHEMLLRVQNLSVVAGNRSRIPRPLVTDVSFAVRPREILGIVGESGSGKSLTSRAIVRLLPSNVTITAGSIEFLGIDLASADDRTLRRIRGREIGTVFQDPMSSLNPVRTVGFQLTEAPIIHGVEKGRIGARWAANVLQGLGFPAPEQAVASYPFAFSGGMRQRVAIGIANSAGPKLIIADEPTTALDVSLQGRVLRLLLSLREENGTAIILVSHDIHVVRSVCERVVVMYGGRMLEIGPTRAILAAPASPYTHALLGSVAVLDTRRRGEELKSIGRGGAEAEPSRDRGCPFVGRCHRVVSRCAHEFPSATSVGCGTDAEVDGGHQVWCWNPEPTL